MTVSSRTHRLLSLAVAGALATSLMVPVLAAADEPDTKPRPPLGATTLKGPDAGNAAKKLPSTDDWEVVHEGTIDKVTVTNPENGESGCHDKRTQTSTPGACN